MIIYGRNPVREALRGRRRHAISPIWATPAACRERWLEGLAPTIATAEEIERQCGSAAHQGVCAQAGGYPYVGDSELFGGDARARDGAPTVIVALDQVQDPQNLGSICRTAECAGAAGLVIPERRSVNVTPAVCKASAGAVEHLRIALVRNLADSLAHAKRAGYWCYGASPAPAGVSYREIDYAWPLVLVLGSEGRGLRPRVASACDQLVSLPTRGSIDSLGVAAAAAALLYGIAGLGARGEGR